MNYEQRLAAAAMIIESKSHGESGCATSPFDATEIGVTATLKPHQLEGISWLIQRYHLGVNVILDICWQMGLGKTLQAISFLSYLKVHQKSSGPYLVLCPLSVTDGWVSEIDKFTPKLKVLRYVGEKEHRRSLRKTIHEHVKESPSSSDVSLLPFDVLLTTYDIALVDKEFLSQIPWHYAIVDEAQRLKNPKSVKRQFKTLKSILKSFMLRRTKSTLIKCGNLVLPSLTEITVMAPLVSLQKKVYASILRKELPKLLALSSSASSHQSLQNMASGKLTILDQLLEKLHDSGHRVLLFAQMTHTLDILQDFLELRKYSYERLDGSVRAEERFAAIRSFSGQSGRSGSESDQNSSFVFMISTRAGGVGLNLVAADTVIFYEQDWNPQVDKQALQRAHRIGQMNHVLSINLVTRHTVEEVIMQRAKRKLQLSHDVVGDDVMEEDRKETGGIETGDLRSIIFGLHRFDLSEVNSEKSNELNASELKALAQKVIALRCEQILDKDDRKFEVNPIGQEKGLDFVSGGDSALASYDPGLDETSYLSWVEKFKETSQSNENPVMDLGNRRNLPDNKYLNLEAAKKKAEEKKLSKWEALGYHSLSVGDPIYPVDGDALSDSGFVHFVVGDCTHPDKLCSSEPSVIFSCVDESGNWGHGGMFDALAKLSSSIPAAYQQASEFRDLHLGDVHLVKIIENTDGQNMEGDTPRWVALAVVQSYNPRRKVPRSEISILDLEACLSKASFAAAQNSASIHMPRIGYQDGTDRSQWYTVERLLRKYASVFGIKIYVLLSTIILRLVLCPMIPWPLSCSSKNRVESVISVSTQPRLAVIEPSII
ncbi:chromodomain-helicase-DNA-binding protein 1-like isoform X1 [Populus alba x Populus x berolinensis]|nr:chromodomain-helicase-DNA-binding protein 1-like isoform X1 [Populus alba x Populus x berolinensis]